MATLNILSFPDDRLRIKARPVEQVDEAIRTLIDNMLETMYAAPGIGLAATQVDVHKRVIVIDVSEDKSQPIALINPEILEKDGIQQIDEGCLSVPGIYEPVERAEHIKFRALDKNGDSYEMEAEGLLAVCVQHEMDHLIGKVFLDRMTDLSSLTQLEEFKQYWQQEPATVI